MSRRICRRCRCTFAPVGNAYVCPTCRACQVCGATEDVSRYGYCPACSDAGSHRRDADIDGFTPYADDARAQAWVSARPDGMSLHELGVVFGVTRERIRQIEAAALAHLRKRLALVGIDATDRIARGEHPLAASEREEDAA